MALLFAFEDWMVYGFIIYCVVLIGWVYYKNRPKKIICSVCKKQIKDDEYNECDNCGNYWCNGCSSVANPEKRETGCINCYKDLDEENQDTTYCVFIEDNDGNQEYLKDELSKTDAEALIKELTNRITQGEKVIEYGGSTFIVANIKKIGKEEE